MLHSMTRRPAGKHYRPEPAPRHRARGARAIASAQPSSTESSSKVEDRAARSSNMVSVLVVISRLTGFLRTSAQAWALGATMLASCYTIADQLPNVLYELVVGGMLITSFLPVYVKVKNELGAKPATEYASNLLSVVAFLMVALTVLALVFAAPVIWTQSAGASETFDYDLAIWLFRCFAIEILLYALSSIFSGVLNAERDYLWSNVAPVLNNVVIIGAFILYGVTTRTGVLPQEQALLFLAIGNPLGVAMQVLIQVPALRRHGIRLRLRVNLRDPALKQTLSIGLPTLIVTLVAYPTYAAMSSSALSVTDAGAAVSYYARVWYVLPFSVFAIPISTTLFTEMSNYVTRGELPAFVSVFTSGMRKIIFTLIPFMLYFAVFSPYLIQIIAGGSFSGDLVSLTAGYLTTLALTLPWYGLSSYLQKACSALMKMKLYAAATCVAAVVQIAMCFALTPIFGLNLVAFSSMVYYLIIDVGVMVQLRFHLGRIGFSSVVTSALRAMVLGGAGAAAGWLVLQGCTALLGPCRGVLMNLVYVAAGGVVSLVVTFGGATLLGVSDAPFFDSIFRRLLPRRVRSRR